jgi:UDP-N-acetylglucosamine:LPS N-acetylglucosamine transferase
LSLLPKLTSHFTIIHQTGPIDRPWIQQQLDSPIARYYPQDYIDIEDIGWVFHQTSLIISRSGANICQEIAAFKTPSVLVPLPFSQQNEQLLNAQWLQQQNPDTIILNESRLDAATLLKAIYQLNPHYSNRQVNPIINYQLRQLIHQLL